MVHRRYRDLKRISEELYGGAVKVSFPAFRRGPLDIYVQLREYQGFIEDCAEDPEYAHRLLDSIVDTRIRYNRLATEFLGEAPPGIQSMDDDWVNVPFISPAMFDEFAAPAYRKVQKAEGPILRFHTCGVYGPVLGSLLGVYDKLESMDVSGWNDLTDVDGAARADVKFDVAYVNTFVLTGSPEQHRAKLEEAKKVAGRRRINLHSQAIVKLLGTIDDSLVAMNRFIDLARNIMAE
jgi:uroporphyrinogen-III decarboxylase